MVCYYPLKAYRTFTGEIVFREPRTCVEYLTLPCSSCVGCRIERSRQWAVRCLHESTLYKDNCFITLTYSDLHVPEDRSLNVKHFQDFMKRLRKRFGSGIRFFHCGEYGDLNGRPHYHACIFNFCFPDRKIWKVSNGFNLYISDSLSELWPFGFVTVADFSYETAAYVARYVMKKVTGDKADEHYHWTDFSTGEIHWRKPEYVTMSRRPGIGKGWFDKYKGDVFPHDYVIVDGRKVRVPCYYDNLLGALDMLQLEAVKFDRECQAKIFVDNCTPERLDVRRRVQELSLKRLPRNL